MADQDYAIIVSNLTKKYRLYDKPIDRLKEALHPLRKIYHHEFTALNDVSFEIKKGQTVGIIGKNGSGKSTLLKILTGVLTPTSGEIAVKGKIAALLELGAGFNPELTGLENIFLNGSLMGYSREEMDTKVDAIIEFADIGEFIHQPVKMYSSGMFARLAFSVAINVEPDILIVDEALSVGDIFFQAKCYYFFDKLRESGKTILFVTHSLDQVVRTCTTAFCLASGEVLACGDPAQVVDAYKKAEVLGASRAAEPKKDILKMYSENYEPGSGYDDYGTKEVTIADYAILDEQGVPQNTFHQGQVVEILIRVATHATINKLICAFSIKTAEGIEVLGANTALLHVDVTGLAKVGGAVRFRFPLYLRASEYLVSFGLTYFDEKGELRVYHRLYNALSFRVNERFGGTGIYAPRIEIHLSESSFL